MRKIFVLVALLATASPAWAQSAQRAAKEVATKTAAVASSNVARAEAAGEDQGQAKQTVATTSDSKAAVDSAALAANPATAGAVRKVPAITREVFSYDGGGRRDPFVSLARNGDLRPYIGDLELKVTTVATDKSRALAMIRDKSTKEMYQVRIGDSLGRYRVVNIDVKSVTFAIEEFGFSRQERLVMTTSSVRNQ